MAMDRRSRTPSSSRGGSSSSLSALAVGCSSLSDGQSTGHCTSWQRASISGIVSTALALAASRQPANTSSTHAGRNFPAAGAIFSGNAETKRTCNVQVERRKVEGSPTDGRRHARTDVLGNSPTHTHEHTHKFPLQVFIFYSLLLPSSHSEKNPSLSPDRFNLFFHSPFSPPYGSTFNLKFSSPLTLMHFNYSFASFKHSRHALVKLSFCSR